MNAVNILHLRHAAGGGGGADTVLFDLLQSGQHRDKVRLFVAYLYNYGHDLAGIREKIEALSVSYTEIAGGRWFDYQVYQQLAALISTQNMTGLHCHDYKSALYAILLRRRFRHLRLFRTLHGWTEGHLKSRVYDFIDRQIFLARFDCSIAVSAHIYCTAQSLALKNLHLLHNGIDARLWQPALTLTKPRPFTIGFVGRMSVEKNPLLFVNVAEQVLKKQPACRFVMVGEGAELAEVEKVIADKNLAFAVSCLGLVTRDAMAAFYDQLDCILLTSVTEGLPLVLLEASAKQIPIVATRVGGVPELITDGENGLLAESNDVTGLAKQVLRLVENPSFALEMGKRGRAKVIADFSLPQNWLILEQLYLTI